MHRELGNPPDSAFRAPPGGVNDVLQEKADICAKILAETQRMVRIGQSGISLNQLMIRARDLLEDVDEVLLALHPERDGESFAKAAALHRQLEQIEAAIHLSSRGPAPTARPDR